MKFEIELPDQVVEDEPEMLDFLKALQLMVNRMTVSHYKYGAMSDKFPDSAHAIDAADKRISMYKETGNTENCLDAANFFVMEYLFPCHPESHFRSQETHESPGIIWHHE